MSKQTNQTPELRKHICEFVNNVINKDYAKANANLPAAVQEVIKAKVATILEENP
jgi:hypothetical protein